MYEIIKMILIVLVLTTIYDNIMSIKIANNKIKIAKEEASRKLAVLKDENRRLKEYNNWLQTAIKKYNEQSNK